MTEDEKTRIRRELAPAIAIMETWDAETLAGFHASIRASRVEREKALISNIVASVLEPAMTYRPKEFLGWAEHPHFIEEVILSLGGLDDTHTGNR